MGYTDILQIGMAIAYSQYEPSLIEPVFPDRTRKLEDLAIDLAAKSSALTRGLHPIVVESLGELVRLLRSSP
jgi:hypothetical protein